MAVSNIKICKEITFLVNMFTVDFVKQKHLYPASTFEEVLSRGSKIVPCEMGAGGSLWDIFNSYIFISVGT